MLDPITAASLAASVISIVDFGLKTTAKCAQVYKVGALAGNKDLESSRQSIPSLLEELDLQIRAADGFGPLPKDEQELLNVAQRCKLEANKLVRALDSIKVQPAERTWHKAIRKGIKSIAVDSKIKGIEENLKRHNDTLHTHLLVDIRRRHRITDEQLKYMHSQLLSKIGASAGVLQEQILSQHEETRQHVTDELVKQFRQLDAGDNLLSFHQKLLKSLEFPQIGRGRNDIVDPYNETCKWIFSERQGTYITGHKWHDFPTWLRSGSGIYWITGKAGSGKSTLMNYIYDCEWTRELLNEWAQGASVLQPAFFFWSSGSKLQQSSEGLIRSLLYQILERDPELADQTLFHQQMKEAVIWNDTTLRKCLLQLVQSTTGSKRLCFFIDGLDEFSGDWMGMMKLMHQISHQNRVKICLASRPENAFQATLGQQPSLQMQHFTLSDMLIYIDDSLSGFCFPSGDSILESSDLEKLVELVLDKAEGVWQWVTFALQAVAQGRINCDSLEQLHERLTELPKDLESLYRNMLDRADPRYRQISQQVLATVPLLSDHDGRPVEPNLFHLAFMDGGLDQDELYSLSQVSAGCSSLKSRWKAATMGLVEFVSLDIEWGIPKIWLTTELRSLLVTHGENAMFSHKTVKTFAESFLATPSSTKRVFDEGTLVKKLDLGKARFVLWKLRYLNIQRLGRNRPSPGLDKWHFQMLGYLIEATYNSTHYAPPQDLDEVLKKIDTLHDSANLDFMGYLATIDGGNYIMRRYDDYNPGFVSNKATHLLHRAMDMRGSWEFQYDSKLQLLRFLLDRGADLTDPHQGLYPDSTLLGAPITPWECFCNRLPGGRSWLLYIPFLELFLQHGIPLDHQMQQYIRFEFDQFHEESHVYGHVIFSVTLLAILQSLADSDNSSEVQRIRLDLERRGALAKVEPKRICFAKKHTQEEAVYDLKRLWNPNWIKLFYGKESGILDVGDELVRSIQDDPVCMDVLNALLRDAHSVGSRPVV